MIVVDSSSSEKLTLKFIPREYPKLSYGSSLVTITDEQTTETFTYDRAPISKNKYWLEAVISRSDIVENHNYTVCVYMYEGENPLIFEGKLLSINFTTKSYTAGVNQKLEGATGDFKEKTTDNDYKVYNG